MTETTKQATPILRALLFKEAVSDREVAWVAQGLELDIAAQGSDEAEAKLNLVATIVAEYGYCRDRGKEMCDLIPAAPTRFVTRFDGAPPGETLDDLVANGIPMQLELRVAA